MTDYFPYNPNLKKHAHKLRRESTLAEILLWKRLNKKQLLGHDFDRQKPIGKYIVDFFCKALKLAIEINGSTHYEKEKYDAMRLKELKKLGISILVFSDSQVKNNLFGVVTEITEWVKAHCAAKASCKNPPRPTATPPLEGTSYIVVSIFQISALEPTPAYGHPSALQFGGQAGGAEDA